MKIVIEKLTKLQLQQIESFLRNKIGVEYEIEKSEAAKPVEKESVMSLYEYDEDSRTSFYDIVSYVKTEIKSGISIAKIIKDIAPYEVEKDIYKLKPKLW